MEPVLEATGARARSARFIRRSEFTFTPEVVSIVNVAFRPQDFELDAALAASCGPR